MVSLRKQIQMFLKYVSISVFLKLLSGLTFLSPNLGNWLKRLFFILTLYHELQRVHMVDHLSLSKLNDKMLLIKEPMVLSKSMEIARLRLTSLDFNDSCQEGRDLRELMLQPTLTRPEAELISSYLVKQTPKGLCYGEQAMEDDIVRMLVQIKSGDPTTV